MKKWSLVGLLSCLGLASLAQAGDMPCIAPQLTREDMGLGKYQEVPAAGGTFAILVITSSAAQCGRSLTESSDFVAVVAGGGERMQYTVAPNTGAARTATLVGNSGGQTSSFEVRQAAAAPGTTAPAAPAVTNDPTVLGAQRTCGNVALSIVKSGTTLKPDTWVMSPSRQYKLAYQTDGNLVLYKASGEVLWKNGKLNKGGLLKMQTDGNLVSYDAANRALWATGTRTKGSVLAVQDDGNLVIYGADSCTPYWARR